MKTYIYILITCRVGALMAFARICRVLTATNRCRQDCFVVSSRHEIISELSSINKVSCSTKN